LLGRKAESLQKGEEEGS